MQIMIMRDARGERLGRRGPGIKVMIAIIIT